MARRMLGSRYRLERQLASGTMSDVYLGHDLVLLRPVAVTFLRTDRRTSPSVASRFIEIGQALASVDSRHLVTIYEIGDDPSDPYIVMEYLGGQTLREIIDNEGPFHPDDVAILIEQVATGLDHAARHGVNHGRLNPEHVIVNGNGLAKIVGFSALSGGSGAQPPNTGDGSRTTAYQIPNPIRGVTSQGQDSYALAAIAYEMLVGQPPAVASQVASDPDAGVIAHPSQVNPDIPVQAGDIVIRMLERSASGASSGPVVFAQELTNWRFAAKPGAQPRSGRRSTSHQPPSRLSSPMSDSGDEQRSPVSAPPRPASSRERPPVAVTKPARRQTPVKWLGIVAFGAAVAALILFWSSLEPGLTVSSEEPPGPAAGVESTATSGPGTTVNPLGGEAAMPSGTSIQANARAVVGLPFDEAEQELASNGVTAIRRDVPNASVPVGIVVGFEGIDASANTATVTLLTSKGTLVEVPPALFGTPLADGEHLLAEIGLHVDATIGVPAETIESFAIDLDEAAIQDGDIVGIQEPSSTFGSLVEPGASLTLVYYDASQDSGGAGG